MTDVAAGVTIVPANEASWDDLQAVFGMRGDAARCQCQRFKTPPRRWDSEEVSRPIAERARKLRAQTRCGHPESDTTSGLVAYLDGEPVGWCAVEPRTAYLRLGRVPWIGRTEDKTDDSVWAVTCLLRHPRGLPPPRRQPCARACPRRFRAATRRPCARGLPDHHGAREDHRLG